MNKIQTDLKYKSPIFYTNKANLSNSVVIILPEVLETLTLNQTTCNDFLLICSGNVSNIAKTPKCSIIVIDENIPFFEVFNLLQEIFNLFEQWDEQLRNICYEGGNFCDLIESCDSVLCDPVSLIDQMFHYIGYSKALSKKRGFVEKLVDQDNSLPLDLVNNILSDQKYISFNTRRDLFIIPPIGDIDGDMMCHNIFDHEKYVGKLGIKLSSNNEHQINYNKFILEHLYIYINKLYNKYKSFNQKEISLSSLRKMLHDHLVSNDVPDHQWQKAYEENGWKSNDQLQLVQFRPNPRYDKNMYANYFCTEIERKWQGCTSFEYNDYIFLLVNHHKFQGPKDMDFYQSLAYFLRESLLIAGLSRKFNNMKALSCAYKQTDIALEFGIRKAPTLWYYNFNDYVLNYINSNCISQLNPEQICSEKLLSLKEYDAKKNTEYYKTVLVYFQSLFNSTETAKRLCIQRSSFFYRMDRIRKLVNINFESIQEIYYLAISLQLLENTGSS